MGLDTFADGLSWEQNFHGMYFIFNWFRDELVRSLYGQVCYEAYRVIGHEFTEYEVQVWNSVCDDDLDIFLWHSDCSGSFTPKECRRVYKALKRAEKKELSSDLLFKMMFKKWKKLFRYCAKHRVELLFR